MQSRKYSLQPSFSIYLNTFPKHFSLDAVMNIMETCLIRKEHVNSEQAISLESLQLREFLSCWQKHCSDSSPVLYCRWGKGRKYCPENLSASYYAFFILCSCAVHLFMSSNFVYLRVFSFFFFNILKHVIH